MKKYASPLLMLADGRLLPLQVVELYEGKYMRFYPLSEEIYSTVWIDGLIQIVKEKEEKTVYCLIPYDCVNRMPVAETQRIRLK